MSGLQRDYVLELGHLAVAIDPEAPCGPDCEYDGDFLALSQAVAGKPEQQFGQTVIPAIEPDWREVEKLATDLLGRTRDLRVVSWLTQALTHLHGVSGFAAGLGLVHLLCEQYWDEVHPRMVIDGEDDPYLRIGVLSSFSDGVGSYSEASEIMRALRAAFLVNRSLPVTVRDVEMTALKDPVARYAEGQIVSVLADAIAAGAESISAFEQAIHSVASLTALVEERMAGGEQPDFSALNMLHKLVGGVIGRVKTDGLDRASDGNAAIPQEDVGVGELRARAGLDAPGEIRSREDVRRALRSVCDYLERHEPSNPASLFARRAERMLGMGFLDIMTELSPDTISHLQMLTGAKPADAS